MNTEIFEIGKVSRCFGCASDETFDSIESADTFRKSIIQSFKFFGLIALAKTIIESLLHMFYVKGDLNEETSLLFPALNIFEVLVTLYAIYKTYMFCACLGQGLIYEY